MTEATVSAASMRIVRLLVGQPPQTVTELGTQLNITRTAITEQLNELLAAGFVEKTIERLPGRGRPRHLFRTTNAALALLFANNQQMVVPAIWEALEQIGGESLTERVLRQLSLNLAKHYRERVTGNTPAERLRQLATVLTEEGGLVEVSSENGELVLRKRSCAFISMFEATGKICHVDECFLHELVGAPVRRTACRHQGDPCCTFEIDPQPNIGKS
jgi:DeoR family transcriptional regulator, suf operon transcriptional repressor